MTLLEQANKFPREKYGPHQRVKMLADFAQSVMPKWTYLPELPTVAGHYIWCLKTGEVGCGAFHPKLHAGEMVESAIAWQPLPPAPRRDILTESQEGGE